MHLPVLSVRRSPHYLLRQTVRMRSSRTLLTFAGLLVVVGLALVLLENESVSGYSLGPASGDVEAPYSSEISLAFDGAWLVTKQSAIGYALVWLGSLIVAGLIGVRVAVRNPTSA